MSTLLSHRHRVRPVALLRLFLGILLPLLVVGLVTEDLLEGQSFAWRTPGASPRCVRPRGRRP